MVQGREAANYGTTGGQISAVGFGEYSHGGVWAGQWVLIAAVIPLVG